MVGRLLSFWDGNFFSGELLVLGNVTRWWFQIFFIFTPTPGNDPIWLISIFFKGLVQPPTRWGLYPYTFFSVLHLEIRLFFDRSYLRRCPKRQRRSITWSHGQHKKPWGDCEKEYIYHKNQPFMKVNISTIQHVKIYSQNLTSLTLLKFSSSPLKSYRNPIGKDRFPTAVFQGRAVRLRGSTFFREGLNIWTSIKTGRQSETIQNMVILYLHLPSK